MRTVHVVTQGEYSDYSILCVFESKERAEKWLADNCDNPEDRDSPRIKEFPIYDDSEPAPRRMTVYQHVWQAHTDVRGEETKRYAFKQMVEPEQQHGKCRIARYVGYGNTIATLNVSGVDEERTRKVFTEQLAGFKLALPGLRHAAGVNVHTEVEFR